MENNNIADGFAMPMEALLDGSADAVYWKFLEERLSKDASARTDYAIQIRMHYILKEYFSLEKAVGRKGFMWLKVAAMLVLLAGMSVLAFCSHRRVDRCLYVSASDMPSLTASEYDMLKARYFAEHYDEGVFSGQLVKYEPGAIENPGAAIEVLQTSAEMTAGHQLNEGDRVWRQDIDLPGGQISFRVGSQGIVTVVGPATVKLHDEKTIEVVSGCVYVEANRTVSLILAGRRLSIDNTSVGVVAREDGRSCDLIVTDGIVLLGDGRCLRAQDGVRISAKGELQAYRSLGDSQSLQCKFLAGVTNVRIERTVN